MTPSVTERLQERPRVVSAALALWAQRRAREVSHQLDVARVPVLVLKGPELQSRLYGTPAVYASSDVDLLVPRKHARTARRALERSGWRFEAGNGVLWRSSRAATYERAGFRVDLHWGLHASHLPAWTLGALERRLWEGARPGPGGVLEPDDESLLVFLAVHVVGHEFERLEWSENVARAAELVSDWPEVWAIARACRVQGALSAALDGRPVGTREPVLDGPWGRAVFEATWFLRGHFVPRELRDRIRDALALGREGFWFASLPNRRVVVGELELSVPRGVFVPWALSEDLANAALRAVEDVEQPIVVDVGTGSGAVALLLARSRPDALVTGTETSPRAVRAARRNARRWGMRRVSFVQTSLLAGIPARYTGRVRAVVTNIPSDPAATFRRRKRGNPAATLVGRGPDGLDAHRSLIRQALQVLAPDGRLVVLLAGWQCDALTGEVAHLGLVPVGPRVESQGRYQIMTLGRG